MQSSRLFIIIISRTYIPVGTYKTFILFILMEVASGGFYINAVLWKNYYVCY